MPLKDELVKLNRELEALQIAHSQADMHNFLQNMQITLRMGRLLVQAKIFAAIHDGNELNYDELIFKGRHVYNDHLLFPTVAEIMANEEKTRNFIEATLRVGNTITAEFKPFEDANGSYVPFFQELYKSSRKPSPAQPTAQPQPKQPTPAAPKPAAALRDDEGVSFFKGGCLK